MYISIGQAATIIGVAVSTLRRWEAEGNFHPSFRTPGNHRRYAIQDIEGYFLGKNDKMVKKRAIAYARVSSHDQKQDLVRQVDRLKAFCEDAQYDYSIITDLGSGVNYKKRGLNQLIAEICAGKVSHLVLTHRDRLLRFGSPLLFKLCEHFHCEVLILDDKQHRSFEEELVADVIEIMTVFTSKVYGKRSHKNRKKSAA